MQALWSPHWHAVRHARLALRDGVQVIHRRLRGRAWVLLLDPVTQRFHRLTPKVWSVVAALNGRRTLEDVWQLVSAAPQHPDADVSQPGAAAVISQDELVQLMSTLHQQDLLRNVAPPDASEVHDRHEEQRRQQQKQRWLNPMSLRWPLWHPDAWFERQADLARQLFSWPVAVLWLMLVGPAVILGVQHIDALTDNLSDRILSAGNLALLWLVYPLVKIVHEWAHGMAVKAWGGRVHEMGVMLVVFTPVPYVDASASYRFASKWARAAVAAAGIAAELALGAVALYVWLAAEDGPLRAIAFNVVLIAGFSTLVVNGNPLMRYDGYFIVCDLLEVPNLAQRAGQYRRYLVDRLLLGASQATPPVGVQGERAILLVYGLVAPVYQLAVTVGVIWFVIGEYLLAGALMALWSVWGSFLQPLWRGWRHLQQSPDLGPRRSQARWRVLALAALAVVGLGFVPVPFQVLHQGVLWMPDTAVVRAQADGHVGGVWHAGGERVQSGELLLQLDNPVLQADVQAAAGALAQAQANLRQAQTLHPEQVPALQQVVAVRDARWQERQTRLDGLQVRAGLGGQWFPAVTTDWEGRHVRRGEVLGHVVDGPARLVRVAVTQEDMALVGDRLRGVEVRQTGAAAAQTGPLTAGRPRLLPGGEQELVSAALGTLGGGEIPVDPAAGEGRRPLSRVFDLELPLAKPAVGAAYGARVDVRFDLGELPLLRQWALRARQVFLARLGW
jgi:putative peptide zinc metalloprotease protein